MKALVAFTLMFGATAVLLASLPHINAWERANAYPYGRMCHSVFTGYVDTCQVGR